MGQLSHHLEKLPYFVSAVESGSILAASKRERIAQPALLRSIQNLEEALGYKLLVRSRSGVKPTPQGQQIYEIAVEILKLSAQATNIHAIERGKMEGVFTFGTHAILASYLWPTFIREVQKNWPKIRIELKIESSVKVLMQKLISGELDFAMSIEYPVPSPLKSTVLYEDEYAFFKAPHFKIPEKVHFTDLPFLYGSKIIAGNNQSLQDALDKVGLRVTPRYDVSNFESIAALCANGMGIAVLPKKSSKFYRDHKMIQFVKNVPTKIGTHNIIGTCRQTEQQIVQIQTLFRLIKSIT